jgi:hypothetical protein
MNAVAPRVAMLSPVTAALSDRTHLNGDSGTLSGKRTLSGGQAQMGVALQIPALVTASPVIRNPHLWLCTAGKPRQVTLTASMRKPIIILGFIERLNVSAFERRGMLISARQPRQLLPQ